MSKENPTIPIAFRLPKSVYAIINRRAGKQNIKPSEWLRKRVIYDVQRKHKRKEGNGT